MAKAVIFISGVRRFPDGKIRLLCQVVLDGVQDGDDMTDYGMDYTMDMQQSLAENIEALKSKILNIMISRGYKMSAGDIIPFGAPIVKDSASASDKASGITSDKDAVAIDPKEAVQAGLFARAWNWLTA